MAYKAPIWEDGKSPAISAENLNNLSQAAEGAQVLFGNSAPTSSTEGAVGQFYLVVVADSDGNYPLYQCVAIANGRYTWRDTRRIPDSITSMLGIPAPGTINRALNVLANVGNLHVWERVQIVTDPIPEVPAGYTLGEETSGDIYVLTGNTQSAFYILDVTYGDSVSADKNGNVSIVSPTTKTSVHLKESEGMQTIQSLVGKYVTFGEPKYPNYVKNVLTGVFYIPPTATVTVSNSGASTTYIPVIGYPYTPAIPAGTTTDYLTSTDPDAYTDGTVGNTTITYLGQIGGGARIEVGSYVGTGTYGSGNKNTLTFKNKRPKKVTVVPKTHKNDSQFVSGSFPFVNGATSAVAKLLLGAYTSRNVNLSWSDYSVSWYSTEAADIQLNTKSVTYFYVAEF